jgi:hypothetical protein
VKRPLPAGAAPGDGPTPITQSVVQAVTGIIRRPRVTFETVVSHPRWGLLLLVTALVGASAGIALMQTAVGKQALVDQWERTAVAFGQEIDDGAYAELEAWSDRGATAYALLSAFLSGPVLTVVVAGLLKGAFRGQATFRQVMAVATHAGIILTMRQVIAAPVSYVRESTASATSLGAWFSTLDEASPAARFLGALDVFVIWWAVVLAIGVAVLYRRRARHVATVFVGVYAALALLLAIAMALADGSA